MFIRRLFSEFSKRAIADIISFFGDSLNKRGSDKDGWVKRCHCQLKAFTCYCRFETTTSDCLFRAFPYDCCFEAFTCEC